MNVESSVTETVVRNHLQAFLEQQGVAAIVADYDEDARFYSEARIYRGKQEIDGFFTDFIASLPAEAIERFTLEPAGRRNIAYHHLECRQRYPAGHRHFRGGQREDRFPDVCNVRNAASN